MTPLWTVAEVVKATGGRPEGLSDGPLTSISIDSREIAPEALFVAIKGDMHDGHDFVGTRAGRRRFGGAGVGGLVRAQWRATS